jgi:lipid II:glycine glycyltransferase (peptidoglycan interpeptide bridge formation enzyme)
MSPLLFFNRMPSSYEDHRVVGFTNPTSSYCQYINQELSQINNEINTNFDLLNKNPNKKIADKINALFERAKSISVFNGSCNNISSLPIWVLMKSFVGYLDELHSQNYITPSTSASGRYVGYDKVTEKFVKYF